MRSAVGFNKARGDQIEVVNLRFAEAPSLPQFTEPTLVQSLLDHETLEQPDLERLLGVAQEAA